MATFGLVHGAWHGAWCFERLTPHLEEAGHETLAVELPSDRPGTTCSDYAALIVRALDGAEDDVVLVGHSFAGLTIPLVAAIRPIGRLVYLAALIPKPGMSMTEQFEAGEEAIIFDGGRELNPEESLSYWVDREAAVGAMYQDCEAADAESAWSRLRPQSRAAQNEVCPLEAFPDTPADYLVCADDRLASNEWGRGTARERLGVDAIEIPGGHSPSISRPDRLAETLLGIV